MSTVHKTGLILSLLLSIASCKSDDEDYTAYFGGEISNPRTSYVVLSKGNDIVDTLHLDRNNRFFKKFDSLTPGMYSLRHEPDYQYVYFDRNDSLMVSANASDFDGSIMFSGRGDKKNNFMMELFLMNEADRKKGFNIYDYEYAQFKKSIDSVNALRKAFYKRNKKEIGWSDGFDFYARNRVVLNYYTKKEYYPYIHARRTGNDARQSLPKDFYDFRKTIEYNDSRFTSFSPFVRYLTAMLNNMAITKNLAAGHTENSLRDNVTKLKIADSVFSNKAVKNQVLNNIAFSYLLEDQNIVNNKKFLESYLELSTDNSPDNEIHKLAKAVENLKQGSKLPQIGLVDTGNNSFRLDDNISRETVIFFWTSCAKTHIEMVYDKISELKQKHPDVDFIAVNVDKEQEWKKMLSKYNNDNIKQVRAVNFKSLKDNWAINKINRTIILNPDGTIKNAFTGLLDPDFSGFLK